ISEFESYMPSQAVGLQRDLRAAVSTRSTEPVERRAETKGNASQQSTCRTVSQALARIRQAFAVVTRGRSRVRENCTYGSARGARGNSRPYRDRRNSEIPRADVDGLFG